jgi:hypothetical protein
MVLIAELLLAVGILGGVYRMATRPADGMAPSDPDRHPAEREDGPLTADELAGMHIPMGAGYRKIDVDRLLDRVARQLPRAYHGEQWSTEPAPVPSDKISLDKSSDAEATDPEVERG